MGSWGEMKRRVRGFQKQGEKEKKNMLKEGDHWTGGELEMGSNGTRRGGVGEERVKGILETKNQMMRGVDVVGSKWGKGELSENMEMKVNENQGWKERGTIGNRKGEWGSGEEWGGVGRSLVNEDA